MMEFPRNREEVQKVQGIAHETESRGLNSNLERAEYADLFADEAVAHILSLEEKGELPYSMLAEHKQKSLELFRDTVRLHIASFSKANNDNLEGTLFDFTDSTPSNVSARAEYVSELMSIACENVAMLGGKDKQGFNLAKYRDGEWIKNWMDGSLMEEHLSENSEYTPEQIKELLEGYPSSQRMKTAVTNIKNPEKALDDIAENYLVKLSDDGIREHFEGRLSEEEITALLEGYPPNQRMRTAVNNIKNPEKALDDIADNYLVKLSDDGIREHFEGRLSEEEITALLDGYPPNQRMVTAVINIKNPEKALYDIATGKLSVGQKTFSFKLSK